MTSANLRLSNSAARSRGARTQINNGWDASLAHSNSAAGGFSEVALREPSTRPYPQETSVGEASAWGKGVEEGARCRRRSQPGSEIS